MDNVTIDITEQITNVAISVIEQPGIDVSVIENNDDVSVTVSGEQATPEITVEEIAEIVEITIVEAVSIPSPETLDLQLNFKLAYNSSYKEFIYSDGKVSEIGIWEASNKGVKLFTKLFTYNGTKVEQIELTDEISGKKQTKIFAYIDGSINNITENIT